MLLNYRATFEDVEGRAVEADDYVTVDLKAVESADNFAAEGRMLIAGSDSNPAEFNEALIGANVDDVKTVTWTDEVEEGEEAETHTVEVPVKGIKVRNTPSSPTSSSKSDFGFDSIDAMRDAIKIEIEQDKGFPPPGREGEPLRLRSRRAPGSSTRWTPTTSSPSLRSLARTSCPTSLPAA